MAERLMQPWLIPTIPSMCRAQSSREAAFGGVHSLPLPGRSTGIVDRQPARRCEFRRRHARPRQRSLCGNFGHGGALALAGRPAMALKRDIRQGRSVAGGEQRVSSSKIRTPASKEKFQTCHKTIMLPSGGWWRPVWCRQDRPAPEDVVGLCRLWRLRTFARRATCMNAVG